MKKILAVAVAAAFYAGTAGAATVYSDDSSRLDILGSPQLVHRNA